jgi:transcription elongation GreA/GreB family factor
MKELEDAPEPTILSHVEPQRVTRARLKRLRADLARAKGDVERRKHLQERIDSAIVVDAPADRTKVGFGAHVKVEDEARPGKLQTFEIVDEADVDIPHGCIGMESPLAQALFGSHVGESVVWKRPAGDHTVTVKAIEYENGGS